MSKPSIGALTTLGTVLDHLGELPERGAVFLPSSAPLSNESQALLLDPNDAEPEEDEPRRAREQGLLSSLGVADIGDARDNLEQQQPGASRNRDLMILAITHFLRHDAFLRLKP